MGTPDPGEGEQEPNRGETIELVGLVPTDFAVNVSFCGVRDAHLLQII